MITKNLSDRIVKEIQDYLLELAGKHDFRWFYDLHQLEMVKSAELILDYYPGANREIVLISCWLHDIVQYLADGEEEADAAKPNHHIEGAVKAGEFLAKYQLAEEEIEQIKRCIERHRNREGFRPESIEEKIVASADAASHFYSVFFMTFFKFHPSKTLDEMVAIEKEKLEKDWCDVNILPEAGAMVESRYSALRGMVQSYKNDFKDYNEDN